MPTFKEVVESGRPFRWKNGPWLRYDKRTGKCYPETDDPQWAGVGSDRLSTLESLSDAWEVKPPAEDMPWFRAILVYSPAKKRYFEGRDLFPSKADAENFYRDQTIVAWSTYRLPEVPD